MLSLDVSERAALTTELSNCLRSAVPDSLVVLRGSLAEGRADRFSDIDLLWDVPEAAFTAALDQLPEIASQARPVASLRLDPDFQRSQKRRLVFLRFADVPLFWRVDLDVLARSVANQPDYDRDNPAARGSEWSWTESGLMNAVAVIKASCRGRAEEANGLLERAETRLGIPTHGGDVRERILRLSQTIVDRDPAMMDLANDVCQLGEQFSPSTKPIPP
jgi:predicted nucleotidyltransferase